MLPACLIAGLLGVLAAPIEAIAGTPGHAAGSLTPGATYVVRPGDTLTSIARRLGPGGDRAKLVSQMAVETGSTAVVPGERIILP